MTDIEIVRCANRLCSYTNREIKRMHPCDRENELYYDMYLKYFCMKLNSTEFHTSNPDRNSILKLAIEIWERDYI